MAKISNGEVGRAMLAARALIEYGHPVTRAGLPLHVQVRLMRLEKTLRERAQELQGLGEQLRKRYGFGRKPDKDSDHYPAYREEEVALIQAESEVPDELLIPMAELRVRDEEQDLVEVECPMVVYLGPLLVIEASAANGNGARPKRARPRKAKGKRPDA
jgi:hypothetical protein